MWKLRLVEAALEVTQRMMPVYLLILAGAILRRVGVLKREHDEGVLHLVFHVMYPCFIIDKLLGSESVRSLSAVAWGVGTGFAMTLLGIAIAWLAAGTLRYERGHGKRTFALSAGIQNFGYTAIPVVQLMWAGSGAMAMLFVHNLGMEIAMWSVGVMVLSGGGKVPWKRLLNGPLVAVVVGLLLVAFDWDGMVISKSTGVEETGVLRTTMRWLGAGAFPVAIFTIGAVIMDLVGKERPTLKTSMGALVLRLALIPVVMLLLARYLPMPLALKQVMIVQAAMPSAMSPILLAKLYGGRPAVAVEAVVVTSIVGMFTLPLVLLWGPQFVGL